MFSSSGQFYEQSNIFSKPYTGQPLLTTWDRTVHWYGLGHLIMNPIQHKSCCSSWLVKLLPHYGGHLPWGRQVQLFASPLFISTWLQLQVTSHQHMVLLTNPGNWFKAVKLLLSSLARQPLKWTMPFKPKESPAYILSQIRTSGSAMTLVYLRLHTDSRSYSQSQLRRANLVFKLPPSFLNKTSL